MLGHVYVVEDARDLAQIVRDVTRYGGAYRPEVGLFFCCFLPITPLVLAVAYLLFPILGYIRIHSAPV